MIILGLIFLACLYVAGLTGKFFNLRNETVFSLSMWFLLFSMCGVFYVLSLPTAEVFH